MFTKKKPDMTVILGIGKPKSSPGAPPPFPGKPNAKAPDAGMEKAPPKRDMPMAGDGMEADDQPMSMEDRMSAVESKMDELLTCVKRMEKLMGGGGEPDGDEGEGAGEPDYDDQGKY